MASLFALAFQALIQYSERTSLCQLLSTTIFFYPVSHSLQITTKHGFLAIVFFHLSSKAIKVVSKFAALPPWLVLDTLLRDWLLEDIGRGDRTTCSLMFYESTVFVAKAPGACHQFNQITEAAK